MADGSFDTLTVTGTSDLGGDTRVGGNLRVGDPGAGLIRTLSVTGAISGGGTLSIAGASDLQGGTRLRSTLQVDGASAFMGNVGITGSLSVSGRDVAADGVKLDQHVARTDNPHRTTAAQVGALVSVGGVSNAGGNIALVAQNAITLTPDDVNNRITIGEGHSTRTDNPHGTTAAQVGALATTGGTISGPLSVQARLQVNGGAIINGVALAADVSGINYPFEYESIGVADTRFNLRLQSPNSIVFHTGTPPTETLAITNTGNVGIGTISPGAKLTIVDSGRDTTWNTAAFHKAALGPHWSHIHWGATGDWYIRSANSTGRVILQDTGGRVGIGTAQPARQLHVHSDNWDRGAEIHASGATAGLSFTDREAGRTWDNGGAGERWVWYSAGRSARLWTPGKDVLEVDPSGNINIAGAWGLGVGGRRWQDMPSWSGGGVTSWDLFYGGGTYRHSTIRAKEDIQSLTNVLARIDRLNPVSFDRRDKLCGSTDIGFIAEEMREVFPECTAEQASGEENFFAWGINESALHGVAIAGIQELSRKFQTLKRGLSVSRCGHVAIGSSQPLPEQQLYVVGNVRLDCARSETAAAGEAALPERPIGFIIVNIHGEDYKIPYYGA